MGRARTAPPNPADARPVAELDLIEAIEATLELLADPAASPKRHQAGVEMPNLHLKPAEISALAAYLAGTNSTGTR